MNLKQQDIFDTSIQYDAICVTTNGIVNQSGALVMGAGVAKHSAALLAGGGIAQLAQGGRIGYQYGGADTAGVVSEVPEARRRQIEGNRIAEEAYNKIIAEFKYNYNYLMVELKAYGRIQQQQKRIRKIHTYNWTNYNYQSR